MKRRLQLVPNWRRVARKSWSFRLGLLAALLCSVEVGLQIASVVKPSLGLALATAVVSLGASIARLFRQQELHDGD